MPDNLSVPETGEGQPTGGMPSTVEDLRRELEMARARIAEVNSESAARRKKLADYEAADAKRQQEAEAAEAARMAEAQQFKELADKHAAKLAEAQRELGAHKAMIRTHQVEKAFRTQAQSLGLRFANERAADTAFKLLPMDALEIDPSGAVSGMDKALKALKETDAYLFEQSTTQAPPMVPLDARAGQSSTRAATETGQEQEARVRARYGI